MAGEDVQETLFKKVYYKNCSGCRVDQYKAVQHGLPIKELFAIWIVVLATVLPISSLFPFLYFMVKDFNIAKQEEDISYYAGFVGLLTMASVNGSITSRPMHVKFFGKNTRPWDYQLDVKTFTLEMVTAAWGTGLIIGPALGGFLAQETLHKHESLRISSVDSVGNLESALLVSEASEYTHEEKGSNPKGSLFTNWPLMSSIIVYCVFSLHDMAYAEIFSLWAVSPRRLGGLSFSTEDVGEVLVISGLALLFFQIFLYPLLEKKLGCIMTSRISAEFIVTGLFTLQNRAVDQHRRGAANGISMALMSLSKAVGPAIGGALRPSSSKFVMISTSDQIKWMKQLFAPLEVTDPEMADLIELEKNKQ
uniref:Major facilitator superfamily (MFS) profile domain-containing protein n=1 Tax=Daucus carota subsp. sativus TaxID=79200 RepID=A0A175YHR5_DAUCS